MRLHLFLVALLVGLAQPGGSNAGCDPQGRPPWSDRRALTPSGRHSVVQAAKQEINRYLPVADFAEDLQIEYGGSGCADEADGCFVRRTSKTTTTDYQQVFKCVPTGYWQWCFDRCRGCWYRQSIYERRLVWEPYTTTTSKTTRNISITDCLYERGWLNMDPAGAILWDASYKDSDAYDSANLYYKFAADLVEAVEFVLLHELAHASGIKSEDGVDTYAQRMIVELRKAKRGMIASFRVPTREPSTDTMAITLTCFASGPPPPLDDLPRGSGW